MLYEDRPNAVHQPDLLYLPHDRVGIGRKANTFRYALTIVDVASRYKEAEPLTDNSATEVAKALSRVYKRGPLTWPRLLQVDPGREFMGAVISCWLNREFLSGGAAWTPNVIRALWNDSTGPWPSGCSPSVCPRVAASRTWVFSAVR